MRLVAHSRGDTLIEVLFAVSVFSMVAVGSMAIMNQGTATAERSLEITLVRQQIDAQAEAIRYIHQAYVESYHKNGTIPTGTAGEWVKMTSTSGSGKGASNPSPFGTVGTNACPSVAPGEKPFIINAHTASVWSSVPEMSAPADGSLPPFAQVAYNTDSSIAHAFGIWIESVPSGGASSDKFVDFHIRACWESSGAATPMTLGTIVRLYDPS